MTEAEEAWFDERFIQGYDNGPTSAGGALWLFRINPDGSVSIARPDDVKRFIGELLERRQQTGDVP